MWRFGITIFTAAFLLFQIQPLIGKHLLPFYGGSPSVWTTCMLFFQLLLCLGYGAAHGLTRKLGPQGQKLAALVLTGACMVALALQGLLWDAPLLVTVDAEAALSEQPVAALLLELALAVGLPFALLSMTSPLTQVWIHRVQASRSPYRYYALSNLGSLLALVSYPFVIEPVMGLLPQAWIWSGLFLIYALAMSASALAASRSAATGSPEAQVKSEEAEEVAPGRRPGWGRILLWLGLSASPSALLVAATNQISQEISVIPFLWVLPLTLYLLSFVLCFEYERFASRRAFGPALFLFGFLALGVLFSTYEAAWLGIGVHTMALFVICMACHGELVRSKPHPAYLTWFYFALSVGGALGGVFCALVAPAIFDAYFEYHVALVAAAASFSVAWLGDRAKRGGPRARWLRTGAAGLLVTTLGLGLGLHATSADADSMESRRNFYGVLRIEHHAAGVPESSRLVMLHGSVVHGAQFLEHRREPGTAFGPATGLGAAIRLHPAYAAGRPMHVGVVGMGVGTIATWGRAQDSYRFYEINPQVVAWARGQGGHFSYIQDCPARTEILVGDGRVLLQREAEQGQLPPFDVLVVDAFAGSAPPAHLLTLEAFGLYRTRLAPDGILAVHCSNAHLRMVELVVATARALDWPAVVWINETEGLSWASEWVLLTRNRAFLEHPEVVAENNETIQAQAQVQVDPWTDGFSNLFELFY